MPTPRANERGAYVRDRGQKGKERPTLTGYVRMFPTPTARDSKSERRLKYNRWTTTQLAEPIGGILNPNWVEWLMGWPTGWTDLKPLEMGKFREWCEQHGFCLGEGNDPDTRNHKLDTDASQ